MCSKSHGREEHDFLPLFSFVVPKNTKDSFMIFLWSTMLLKFSYRLESSSLWRYGQDTKLHRKKKKRKIKWGKLLKKLEKKDSGNLFQGCDARGVQSSKKWKRGCASLMDYVDAESSFEEKPLKTYNPLYTSYFTDCNSETTNNNSQNFLFF